MSQAFPTHDASVVQELVGVAHSSLDRVKALVSRHPALAKAVWDWGYGEIAEYLLEHGAPPTIFSATCWGRWMW